MENIKDELKEILELKIDAEKTLKDVNTLYYKLKVENLFPNINVKACEN